MDNAIIRIENMRKSYQMGDTVVGALNEVSITINKGDFVAIKGPSGSGKSTLMNMIGCLDQPDSGEYWLEDQFVNELKDYELAAIRNEKVGFIFQNFNLIGKLTAFENVELPLIYGGLKAKERRRIAAECLEQVGLDDRGDHLPNQLSGGQQQRVAIARALSCTPPILLADEPTGALDSQTSKEIIDILDRLNQEGHTIVLITHDPQVADRAKRIIQIKDGEVYEGEEQADEHTDIR